MHEHTPIQRSSVPRRLAVPAIAAALLGLALAVVVNRPGHPPTTPPTPTSSTGLHLTGGGNALTPVFTTTKDWAISFKFGNCAAFTVTERGGTLNGVPLAQGASSTGTMYVRNAEGSHQLVITSDCSWSVVVVNGDTLPRAGGAS